MNEIISDMAMAASGRTSPFSAAALHVGDIKKRSSAPGNHHLHLHLFRSGEAFVLDDDMVIVKPTVDISAEALAAVQEHQPATFDTNV
jgi:hypothetical protein